MILYIGNRLTKHGNNPTGMEFLASKLSLTYDIRAISDRKSKILRLLHIVSELISKRNILELVLIDTYSTLNFYFAFVSAIACQVFKIKYIAILRGGNLPRRLDSNPKLCRIIFGFSYKLVSPSLYLQKAFSDFGYKVHFIPNAMDIARYKYSKREINSPKLLYVRSFHKTYNPTLAVRVVKELSINHPNVMLTMVGPDKDGSLQEVKELSKQLRVDKRIKFTGYLSKDDIISTSMNHNIFINTTNFDNMPVSVMEAMALGIPVVSTNVGGMPYLIKDEFSGLLVEKENTQAMVYAIEYLVNNPDVFQEISFNARQSILKYDWVNIYPKWKVLMDEVL